MGEPAIAVRGLRKSFGPKDTGVVMIAVSISTILTPKYLGGLLGSAALGAALIAVAHSDSIGMSGPSFGLEAMALTGRRAMRAYFSGQNIALGMIAVPLLTLISFGLAAVAKHPVDGFLGMAVDLAGIGAALALGSGFTVTAPYPVEKRIGSPTPRPVDGYTGNHADRHEAAADRVTSRCPAAGS